MTYAESLWEFKVDFWKAVLRKCEGNVTHAAKLGGVNRTYLCRLVKKLELVDFGRPPRKPVTLRARRRGPCLPGEPKRAPRPKREWGPGAVNAVAPFKKRQARLANAG